MAFGEGAGQEAGNKSWGPREKSLWLIAYGSKQDTSLVTCISFLARPLHTSRTKNTDCLPSSVF